jgi:hypothetical protein
MRLRNGFAMAGILVASALLAPIAAYAQDKQDKKDDDSFSAGVNLSAKADAKDVGVPIYPGSRPHKDNSDDSSAGKFGLWGGSIGFKMALLKMETGASPDKVAAFYKKALAKYGKVLDCTNAPALTDAQKDANEKSNTLACDDDHAPAGGFVFKAGTHDEQRLVSIEPLTSAAGTNYSIVYVATKSGDRK